ncbi:hypothetical protein FRC09_016418 [Ceratobasidium sp. 395]|nr:hypothetical protein FRC09_016418 [Ceratobasidium sp. 395]
MFELPNQINIAYSISANVEGSNDGNPIIVPGVRAIQFRHLLLYFYGTTMSTSALRITDPAYRSLILDATNESEHHPDAFVKYFHIAILSHRFCFPSVEAWALGQLDRVLQSCDVLAEEDWADNDDLLDALAYSKLLTDRETVHNVRNLVRDYASRLDDNPDSDGWCRDDPQHLVQLYKRLLFKQEDPALFGYVFCVILSAKHESVLWKLLSRDERSQFFTALVHLTPLPETLPTNWIYDTSMISEAIDAQLREECFDNCAKSLLDDFSNGLNHSRLGSGLLRIGLVELLKLTYRRRTLETKLRSAKCTCGRQLLQVIDLKINNLFVEIAEKYHNCLD